MRQILRILYEGAAQAWQQLMANKLRSFLSLLGVTIGIFCIIGVKSAVNSLEDNIRGSMAKLGNDVIYIEKFSWGEDPGQNFWKWMRRPNFSFVEYEQLEERLNNAAKIGFWQYLGSKTIKWKSSSTENVFFLGITEDCSDLFHLEFQGEGRYFTPTEYQTGSDVCLMGAKVAEGLFGEGIDPTFKVINVGGRKLRVIGVLNESGNDLLKPFNFDNGILVSYTLARRGFNIRRNGQWERTSLMVQAKPGVELDAMKDEITGVLRSVRRLKPREENNFALNTLSILSGLFDNLFSVINLAGFVIGIFALIVGMFSVANIMFVSVRERTNIIGIKMALGAKRWFILLEILFEAVVLCIVGGALGLMFIWGVTKAISSAIDFDIHLSLANTLVGVLTSVIVGVLSGLIPAIQASGMDPVEAIRK
ncbi:MAG: ABC transporter permease [Lewinellaceae bacterium]|nr:ABC transporter permease [Saprospiraceae bacterium]MCB9331029.1 ABC transporter permease [Lewinellaceae bacterium]